MLTAAGSTPAKSVWAHGFINIGGAKLSNSAGTELGLLELIDRHGADSLRYFLMREVPWDGDRDFGEPLNRAVSMVKRYRSGRIQRTSGGALTATADAAMERYRAVTDQHRLHQSLAAAFELVRAPKATCDDQAPWTLAKAERSLAGTEAPDHPLWELTGALATLSTLLGPSMPVKAEAMSATLGDTGVRRPEKEPSGLHRSAPGDVLFPRAQ